jgi:hypothetical protein
LKTLIDSPPPIFDEAWYISKYDLASAIARKGTGAYRHFLDEGAAKGYNPSPHFEEMWYRAANPEVANAIRSGKYPSAYHHYLYEGARLNWAPNPYFDPDWYVAWYPHVGVGNAFEHYVTEGVAQGLSPNPYFDEIWYLNSNPDVEKAVEEKQFFSGHQHFLEKGEQEGRRGSPLFDSAWYLRQYPDAREYIQSGLASGAYDHFWRYGRRLGRRPGPEPSPPGQSAAIEYARRELDDFLSQHKRLELQASDSPLVSIVVVGHDRAELILRCLRSIANWVDVPHEVIVEEIPDGVIGPRADGQVVGKYILYLSSSAELQVGAVQSAVEILEREPDVGAVGGKIIGDDGSLLEAGCYLKKNGWPVHFGRGQAPFQSAFMHRRDVPFVSATFLMTRSDLAAAYREDPDYGLELWKRGLRVVYNPESIVVHHEAPASPCAQPAISRKITTLRRVHTDYLAAVSDNGIGPVSTLDGCRARKGYVVIVNEIPTSFYRPDLILQMLTEGLFITLYPVIPWLGCRRDLNGWVSPEVEVVAEKGIKDFLVFCEERRGMYEGVIAWTEEPETAGCLVALRQHQPGVRICSPSPVF